MNPIDTTAKYPPLNPQAVAKITPRLNAFPDLLALAREIADAFAEAKRSAPLPSGKCISPRAANSARSTAGLLSSIIVGASESAMGLVSGSLKPTTPNSTLKNSLEKISKEAMI
jgi:hypothetical protein